MQTLKKHKEFEHEAQILMEMGLEDYEIEYLSYLRGKQNARRKWQDAKQRF